jgi:hypothetical protein
MSAEDNITIVFNPSALKRGCTEDDIYKAFETFCYDGDVIDDPDADNKYLLIGFDLHANFIEVMYNVIDDVSINVFHAMKCRRVYLRLTEE